MAPNKFEQHIKEELNRREIEPTSRGWNKIANKLDEPQQKRKFNYLWWGIAASFAGLLILSTIYFNYDKTDINDNHTVVDRNKENIEIIESEPDTTTGKAKKNQITNTTIIKHDNIEVLDDNIKLEKLKRYPQKNEITMVAKVNPQFEVEINMDEFSQGKLIQQKIAEVAFKVDKLEQNDNTLTDMEVDSLILQAQQEILQNKIFRQDQSVDAMALLNEVESELDKPLKEQLFDLLKKGIFETRNAIADRY